MFVPYLGGIEIELLCFYRTKGCSSLYRTLEELKSLTKMLMGKYAIPFVPYLGGIEIFRDPAQPHDYTCLYRTLEELKFFPSIVYV